MLWSDLISYKLDNKHAIYYRSTISEKLNFGFQGFFWKYEIFYLEVLTVDNTDVSSKILFTKQQNISKIRVSYKVPRFFKLRTGCSLLTSYLLMGALRPRLYSYFPAYKLNSNRNLEWRDKSPLETVEKM